MGPEDSRPDEQQGASAGKWRRLVAPLLNILKLLSNPLCLAVLMVVVIVIVVFAGTRTLAWMESPEFCARCHTMAPEVSEHAVSAHATVDCSECHVGSGIDGFVEAKIGGLRQTAKLLLGNYADPIPPAADKMPPAGEVCLKCHDPAAQKANALITRAHYLEDEDNTELRVALVLRQSQDGDTSNGIHWHVLSNVEYIASDDEAMTIDWIGVERPGGTRTEYISESLVEISEQAGATVAKLREDGEVRRMTCYDCHNRVGHAEPLPGKAIDQAMFERAIDPAIPYAKRNAMALISDRLSTESELVDSLRRLTADYHRDYAYLFISRSDELGRAVASLQSLGAQFMQARAAEQGDVYPNYLGHTDSAGCFRCHDGGHFSISDGRLTDEPIPATCSTCHTFPTTGENTPNVMVGAPPLTHSSRLWVFDHKNPASTEDAICASCHSQTYCQNCHETGASLVNHDNMLFDHGAVIRETTTQPCTYCHQKPSCERCHSDEEIKDYPPPPGDLR